MMVRREKPEAPRNFDSASRRRHPERSRGIFIALPQYARIPR